MGQPKIIRLGFWILPDRVLKIFTGAKNDFKDIDMT